jgi:uncharacterized protein
MIIDVNTALGHWPFQKFALNSAAKLARHLKSVGIGQALVSSTDAILYPDPAVCNAELFKAVRGHPMLSPVPTVNPALSNWRPIVSAGKVNAVRIVPNYHCYSLTDCALTDLMQALAERKTPLMIQMRVDDERNQYPLMQVAGVAREAVIRFANRFPDMPIICLCAYFGEARELVQNTANVSVDLSFIETFRTLSTLLEQIPAERVLFGSHAPFLYTRSALMKLEAIAGMPAAHQAIAHANAARFTGV